MFPDILKDIAGRMPRLAGALQSNVPLPRFTRLRVGGPAQLLFLPKSEGDLAYFLSNLPDTVQVTVIGLGSNILIRDGGVEGAVIRLPRSTFGKILSLRDQKIVAGAAVPDNFLARRAADASLAGFSFMTGIPGCVGGAVRMNAGAYGQDTASVIGEVQGVDRRGTIRHFNRNQIQFGYRSCTIPNDVIITQVTFIGRICDRETIYAQTTINEAKRNKETPAKEKTAGSTFKNPSDAIAWKLIKKCGLAGYKLGDAQVSALHANYLINCGRATSDELERLGEEIRLRVKNQTGFDLEWEVERIGKRAGS